MFVKGRSLPLKHNTFLCVRLPDDDCIRWPKHVVAKYNEYIIPRVFYYLNPITDIDFINTNG